MTTKIEEYISLEEWARIVALAWIDEDFKNKFELNPRKTVEELLEQKKLGVEMSATKRQLVELAERIQFKRFFEVPPCPVSMSQDNIDEILSGKQTHVIPYLTV